MTSITFVVIGLILLVSFYDYFTARKWQQVTSNTRNDIVFESRNKEYGAYVIRRDYDKKIIIIFLSLCLAIGSAFGILKIYQNMPEEKEEEVAVNTVQVKVKIAPKEIVIPPPVVPPPPPLEKLVQFIPPVVVDEVVDNQLVDQDKLEGKIDVKDQKGEEFDSKIVPRDETPKVTEVVEEIVTYVDEEASFPDYNSFIVKNLKYPEVAIDQQISGKVYIEFIVDKGGNVSNITLKKGITGCPECDKEALRVIGKMPKWTPGKVNGKPVKSKKMAVIVLKLE
jgi:periplasmic protein TonB